MATAEETQFLFECNNAARPLGLWVGVSKFYDPYRGNGPYMIMTRKTSPDAKSEYVRKYQTATQVEDYLADAAAEFAN